MKSLIPILLLFALIQSASAQTKSSPASLTKHKASARPSVLPIPGPPSSPHWKLTLTENVPFPVTLTVPEQVVTVVGGTSGLGANKWAHFNEFEIEFPGNPDLMFTGQQSMNWGAHWDEDTGEVNYDRLRIYISFLEPIGDSSYIWHQYAVYIPIAGFHDFEYGDQVTITQTEMKVLGEARLTLDETPGGGGVYEDIELNIQSTLPLRPWEQYIFGPG